MGYGRQNEKLNVIDEKTKSRNTGYKRHKLHSKRTKSKESYLGKLTLFPAQL